MPDRYSNIGIDINESGTRSFRTTVYPDIPLSANDTYVITTGGDRYDTLAQQFYGDAKLWWIIASANNSKKDGLIVEPGIQLRIPASAAEVIRLFDELNENR